MDPLKPLMIPFGSDRSVAMQFGFLPRIAQPVCANEHRYWQDFAMACIQHHVPATDSSICLSYV